MNTKKKTETVLGEKIPLVGRTKELDNLKKKLFSRGDSHAVYFVASGGVGKTRILLELVEMVNQAGAGYLSTGIVDLYHTDNHSPSDLERILVERLDPENKYFPRYRDQRKEYTLLRELGAGTDTLERMRAQLAQIFKEEWGRLANEQRKLVIIFDTIELLQYESSKVEEYAGLDSINARIKPWMLDVLPDLPNLLVVFAGRPKTGSSDQSFDHQTKLETDLRRAFHDDRLEIFRLKGLTPDEMRKFLEELCGSDPVVPEDILPIVHKCTDGAPIFLHLIADLFRRLVPEYKGLVQWFRDHAQLVKLPEGNADLEKAREEIKIQILRGIFNQADELGLYLSMIAMMPKGIDQDILNASLGLPPKEANELLAQLANLSFVKRFQPPVEGTGLYEQRLFLHDEMYQLFRLAGVVPDIRVGERTIANALVTNFYNPRIQQLEAEVKKLEPKQRSKKRHELETLQVERLHYLMIQNPVNAFSEYKRLTDDANRRRLPGYSMRLHDEFLRFYNIDERRKQFGRAGIPHEQVIRESAELWVERFHWWGQPEKTVAFAEKILTSPEDLNFSTEKNADMLGNICALWGRAKVMTEGFDLETVKTITEWLERQPPLLETSSPAQILTRARLETTLGFLYRDGERFVEATHYYSEALASFDSIEGHKDELAMLLNNISYVYARLGRFDRAVPLVDRALKANLELGSEYSTGLTYSTLAEIERMQGNYPTAIKNGIRALGLFNRVNDPWGKILALANIANAKRRLAKDAIQKELDLDEALTNITEARDHLNEALGLAEKEFPARVKAIYGDLGKVNREMGRLALKGFGNEQPTSLFRASESNLNKVLEEGQTQDLSEKNRRRREAIVNRADLMVDLAELYFHQNLIMESSQQLNTAEQSIGSSYLIGEKKEPAQGLVSNYFLPLGKVERLRGEILFKQGQPEKGLKHAYLAYIYFRLFSEAATERQSVIDYLYRQLQDYSVEKRKSFIAGLEKDIEENFKAYESSGFVEILKDLLG